MAEAMGVDLDRRLTAKLMLLEYFKPTLFQVLGAWQAAQGGESDEIRQLEAWHVQQSGSATATIAKVIGGAGEGATQEEVGRSGDGGEKDKQAEVQLPTEIMPWVADHWVRRWLALEPRLARTSLTPYFFFARERTGAISQLVAQLSSAARSVLQQLLVSSEVSHRVATTGAKNLSPVEAGGVFDALARHTSTVGGMEKPDSALAGLLRFVEARPELQGQLVAYVRSLPVSSIASWVPPLLAAALTSEQHHPARDAIFARWKSGKSLLKRATEMAEKTLKAVG